ncbi:MAG TPA: hypothetical protein VJ372_15780 [Pyrinomonadaceae bacterium]|jgi:hypothetical protein|nr:hypothetical protein [Pyrinomonadaceae bacterium]
MSKWIIGTLLFVVATVTLAQTRKSDPRLQYVGAITINSANPKALAGWYTEKLGLDASSETFGWRATLYSVSVRPQGQSAPR